jgi:hypothetical protein
MSTENRGGMIWTGKIEELGEKPVPVSCPPQISHMGVNPGLHGERSATNCLREYRFMC